MALKRKEDAQDTPQVKWRFHIMNLQHSCFPSKVIRNNAELQVRKKWSSSCVVLPREKQEGLAALLLGCFRGCAKEMSSPLTLIFNTCLRSCIWPTLLKQSNAIPTFKQRDSPKNYRSISLLSIISETSEKIIASHLAIHFNKSHLSSTRQYGFRKNRYRPANADACRLVSCTWSRTVFLCSCPGHWRSLWKGLAPRFVRQIKMIWNGRRTPGLLKNDFDIVVLYGKHRLLHLS